MLSQLLTSTLAISSVAAAIIYENEAASLAARQTVQNCPDLHVIAAGGANSTVPSSIGRLGTLAMNITSQVPNSDFISVPYDKVQIGGMGQKLHPGAIDKGIMNMEMYVAQFQASCPNSKMAFIGYSSGAVITMGSICAGSVSDALAGNQVVAVVVYGDPTRVPGLSYDIGTGPQCVGKDSDLRDASTCSAYAPILQSYCDKLDPQCCSGPNSDYPIHLSYPGKYDLMAAKFVVDQYNKLTGNAVSSMSMNSSMSATSSSATATGTGIVGGGFGGSGSMTTTSATYDSSASAASMASALSVLGASASSDSSDSMTATSAATGSSSATLAPFSPSTVTETATDTARVTQASSTLTPFNANGASLVAPSIGLGALAMIMVALF